MAETLVRRVVRDPIVGRLTKVSSALLDDLLHIPWNRTPGRA